MYERLKKLTYYCPDDEGGELFQATCSLCYQMVGLGDSDKAEVLYGWAKEMAEASREWAIQEEYGLDEFITWAPY